MRRFYASDPNKTAKLHDKMCKMHKIQNTLFMFKKQSVQTKETFKHFIRKNYSMFCSLHHEVRIGVLSVATLTAASTTEMTAQTVSTAKSDSIPVQNLEEVSVTGTRTPIAADKAARIVSVITKDEIARSGAASVNDLLKLTVGVDVRQRSGFGVQTDISINGGTFDQITILLNGVSINNPHTGHLAADFPVSTDDIERIEILEGAAGRLFGSQAFSGAINIVTHKVTGNNIRANISAGSFGTYENGAGLSIKNKNSSHFISGNYRRSDGGTANSNFNQGKLFYNRNYKSDKVKVDFQAGFSTQDYGANTFYSAAYPNQWEKNSRILVSAKAETEGKIHFSPQVSWIRSTDHFQLIHKSPTGENFHRNDVFNVSVNAWTKWALGRTAIGAELRNEEILSSKLGLPMDSADFVKIHGHKGKYYTNNDSRANISYFLEHNVVLQKLTVSAGLFVNRNTSVDCKFRLYPGIDLSYRANENLRFFASWNKAMRLPTYTDLYYDSPTQKGDVGLKPEKTSSFKAGGELRNRFLNVTAQAYYNHCTDMIDWVMRSPDDKYNSANFTLDNYGFSVTSGLDFRSMMNNHFFIDKITLSYAYIYQDRKDDEYIYKSNYALEYLRHKFVFTLDHRIVSKLSGSWSFRWQKREGSYISYVNNKNTGNLVKYSPYGLLNLKLMWQDRNYEIYVSADNLTSHRYYDLGNIKQPGCWIMGGLKLKFGI